MGLDRMPVSLAKSVECRVPVAKPAEPDARRRFHKDQEKSISKLPMEAFIVNRVPQAVDNSITRRVYPTDQTTIQFQLSYAGHDFSANRL